ncbi:G-protein coupled receptor 182-like [Trichomycterus rosablanca]|uniref:G-protein coupled receptor 182-like n=1 Tax=Trichomycterus rosablanca TaxID=2290929 RepID=UPI002F35B7EB
MDNESDWSCDVELDLASRRIGLFLLYLFMFIAGLALNLTALWVNWQRRRSRNTVIFCMLNMGVADTLLVLTLPISMLEAVLDHVWLWGDFLCRFSNLVIVTNIFASCFFVAYMSVERYFALVRGSAPRGTGAAERRKRYAIGAALWILALFFAALETAHVRVLNMHEPGCYMLPEHAVVEWSSSLTIIQLLLQFLLPSAIIVTFNTLLSRAVRSSPEVQSRRGDGVWLLHVYSAVFLVCWFPYHTVMLLLEVYFSQSEHSVFDCNTVGQLFFSYTVVSAVALLHCLANPVLYSFLSRSFRNKLVNLVLSRLPQDALANLHANDTGAKEQGGKKNEAAEHSTNQSEG